MANQKTVKIVTIAVLAVFIIFMGLSAVMYFAGGTKPTQNTGETLDTGTIIETNIETNTTGEDTGA